MVKKFIPFSILIWISVFFASCKTSAPLPATTSFNIYTLDSSARKILLPPSEPHIVINRKIPGNIVGGSILDNVYYTGNDGKQWTHTRLSSPYGVYGDPVLISDNDGRIYYFHLAAGKNFQHWLEGIVMQYTDDGGKTWSSGVLIGKNGSKQQDKPWPAIDYNTGRLAVSWTEFDRYGSKDPGDKSRILISFSGDKGKTWTKPVKINDIDGDCLDDDNTVEGAIPVFDDAGNIYVVWAYNGKLWMDYSTDGGITWHKDRIIGSQTAGWNFTIEGIYRANGLPVFFRDKKENFYVVYGDKPKSATINIIVSQNKGQTWSNPYTLPNNERDQFLPAADFMDSREQIVLLYYDRSRTQGTKTEVSMAFFTPDGNLLHTETLTSMPFQPVPQIFFGDYIGLDIYRNRIAAIWTEMNDQKTRIRAALSGTPGKNFLKRKKK